MRRGWGRSLKYSPIEAASASAQALASRNAKIHSKHFLRDLPRALLNQSGRHKTCAATYKSKSPL